MLLQADVTANDEQDQALLQDRFGLPGPPAIMFFGADGQELKRLTGWWASCRPRNSPTT